jgi:hypothetical protein
MIKEMTTLESREEKRGEGTRGGTFGCWRWAKKPELLPSFLS